MESRENATPVISKLNLLAVNTRVFNLYKAAKTGNIVKRSRIIFFLCNQTFTATWTKSVIVYTLTTGEIFNILQSTVWASSFHFPIVPSLFKSVRYPSYWEYIYSKMTERRPGTRCPSYRGVCQWRVDCTLFFSKGEIWDDQITKNRTRECIVKGLWIEAIK